jgi:nicotinamidase-related amidase
MMAIKLLTREQTGLVVIDIQEKLFPVIHQNERVRDNTLKLIHMAKLFNIPIVLTEQLPDKIGPTLPEIKEELHGTEVITKTEFSCCAVDPFLQALKSDGLINIILTGIESHICVLQTCLDLLERGYIVHVPRDAVDSRTEENWLMALNLMEKAGAVITSTETVIFQILKKAGTKEFKQMLKLIK